MGRSVLISLAYSAFAGFFAFLALVLITELIVPSFATFFVFSSVIGGASVSAFCGSRLAALTSYWPNEIVAALFTAGAFPAATLIVMLTLSWPSLEGGHIRWGAIVEGYGFLFAPGLFAACLVTGLFVGFCSALRSGAKRRSG
jgi:hypothetical protein